MKKLLLLLLPLFIWGCGKNYNNLIDTSPSNSQVSSVSPVDKFTYSEADSLLPLKIAVANYESIQSVSFNIYDPDGNQLNAQPEAMKAGNLVATYNNPTVPSKEYTGTFPMKHSYVNGKYQVDFFLKDADNSSKKGASQYFLYSNSEKNVAPEISNLNAPDTVALAFDTTYIFISVAAQDSNGLSDIKTVYFNSYIPPDYHASGSNPFVMYDDGTHTDKVPGDGIYSLTIILPPTGVTKGLYKFEFFAEDRSGAVSNKITHYIDIK